MVDVKPLNVCIAKDGIYKFVDFGAAVFVGGRSETDLTHLNVTPAYAAPEHHQALARRTRGPQAALAHSWGTQLFHFGASIIDMMMLVDLPSESHWADNLMCVKQRDELTWAVVTSTSSAAIARPAS